MAKFDQTSEEGKVKRSVLSAGADEVSFSYPLQMLRKFDAESKVGGMMHVRGDISDDKVIRACKSAGYIAKFAGKGRTWSDEKIWDLTSEQEMTRNAEVINAKFKVGDKVNDRAFGGPLYIVGLDYVNGSLHGYFVSNRPNGPRTMEKMEKDLVAANSALNAKFPTGSEVLCYPGGDRTKKPYHGIVRKYIGNGTWDVFVKEKNTTLAADEKSIVAANAKFNVGDIVYLGGIEKMKVLGTDHGWIKCEYLEGSHKGVKGPVAPSELSKTPKQSYVRSFNSERTICTTNAVVAKAMNFNPSADLSGLFGPAKYKFSERSKIKTPGVKSLLDKLDALYKTSPDAKSASATASILSDLKRKGITVDPYTREITVNAVVANALSFNFDPSKIPVVGEISKINGKYRLWTMAGHLSSKRMFDTHNEAVKAAEIWKRGEESSGKSVKIIDKAVNSVSDDNSTTAFNANVRPEIQKEYDAYVKAKAKFDKWWNPDRRMSEGGKEARELQEAEKAVWKKWLAVFGKPIPSGWASNPSVLANAETTSCNATFKKGDRIKLKGGRRTGTVIGESTDRYHAGQYDIQWDSYPKGMLCPVKPENLVANATSCNAKQIKIVQRGGYWWCMMPDGNLSGMSKTKDDAAKWAEQKGFKDWVVVNNAQSCNAGFSSSQWGKFKKGDKVRCKFCHEDEIGLLQGVSCYGLRTDFSDTAFRVDFPTQKGVSCLGCELVKA